MFREHLIELCLLDYRQIPTLDVLNKAGDRALDVIEDPYHGLDRWPPEQLRCAPTPLAGNELEGVLDRSHENRLKLTRGLEGVAKLLDRRLIEVRARLIRRRTNGLYGKLVN
jgi:hypothetical protein